MRLSVLMATSGSLLLASCVTPPDNHPREQALVTENIGLGTDNAPLAVDKWWKGFGDPQFDRLLELALAQNPTLAQSLARMRGAQAELARVRSQDYPQVSIDIDEERQRFSETYIIPPPFGGSTNWIGTAQGKLSWNIDFWGKQAALISQSRSSGEARALDARAAKLSVLSSVTQAYIDLDRAYALADIAGLAEKQRQSIVDLATRRSAAGIDSKEQLREAEVLLAKSKVERARAEAAQSMAVHLLAALTGQGANAYPTITRPNIKLDALLPLPQTLPADLLTRRADIVAARFRIDAALSGRDVAKAAFYPDIDLVAFAGFAAIGMSALFTAPSQTFGGGPMLHLPIFDAGKLDAEYERSNADIDAAVASYNGVVVDAVRQTADRLTQLSALRTQYDEQTRAVAAAEDGYRIANNRYRAGLTTYLAVLYAETELFEARQQKAVLAAAQAANRIDLLIAVGGSFKLDYIKTVSASVALKADQDKRHE